MPRFIALPVRQGDAFYLDLGGRSVLVDGGRSERGIRRLFESATQTNAVRVAICTHNDADHANGILGFVRKGLQCDEMWLPGRWLATLPRLLKPFGEVFAELASDIGERPELPIPDFEIYADQIAVEGFRASPGGPAVPENGWPEAYMEMLRQAKSWGRLWRWDWPFQVWGTWPYQRAPWRFPAQGVPLLRSAIDAADRIRKIALAAFHRGIPVRWFEYDTTNPEGGLPWLQPLNSRQLTEVAVTDLSLLALLALTVANQERLVFWSPPEESHPGVLFTADSDLAHVNLPVQLNGAIATAPHHGAEANAKAYVAVSGASPSAAPSLTWVRSDGRYRGRPGPGYIALQARRICTLCRSSNTFTPRHEVQLFARRGVWTRHTTTHVCSCR